ncbi:LamG-like jellyroll fold domain-containing protein [Flammeovirgaceae bacterium SG7u.111]|nr:LamG-like jellyroll fold domain-containing protein [Flammeovirgaceae bacterium SG7u.132]WPO36006.1 LamG-like jellyroll fold domain-containing protein [Flammeovirgaceae bacterium SG7u.111]
MKRIYIYALALALFSGCNEGIDPISYVDPGPDMAAPEVTIDYPTEGTLIRVKEDVTPIEIKLQVVDDIEIASISVMLDGSEINNFTSFKDYRIALEEFVYDNLTNGTHTLAVTGTDLAGKATTSSVSFEKVAPYKPVYDGEIAYMPFDGDYMELVEITNANKTGNPGFETGKIGKAYAGATDAYVSLPTDNLMNTEFSAAFWYKVNADPDRAGILTMGPPDETNPTAMNNRTSGFRLFRENAGGMQRVKLNVGNGSADSWFDGGAAADIDPAAGDWIHIAFTISSTECVVYLDGQVASQGGFTGVDWSGCDILSIGSGAPRFTGWSHLSDNSLIDELRIFNKALGQTEIQAIIDAEK